jgi:hypothetical protein
VLTAEGFGDVSVVVVGDVMLTAGTKANIAKYVSRLGL